MYSLKKYDNGFEYIEVSNAAASAKIALQGAHIYEYTNSADSNLLWLSPEALFQEGVAIRGGIPICWPRFGSLDESMPQHGFARVMLFKLLAVSEVNDSSTELLLELQDTQQSRQIWNHKFSLEVKITLGKKLEISLKTRNLDAQEFLITQALHSYFRVSNIDDVHITGLENVEYHDTLRATKNKEATSIVVNEEIDRVYVGTKSEICLHEKQRSVKLQTKGSNSTVLWNPWIEKTSQMSYMKKDAYREFVCIESANAFEDFVIIKSKKSHTLSLNISF